MNFRPSLEEIAQKLRAMVHAVGEIIYGMTVYEMVRDLRKGRAHREHLFILITMGDLLGVPILPPYYACGCCPTPCPRSRPGATACCASAT